MSHAGTEDKLLPSLFPENLEGLRILDVGHGLGQTGLFIRSEFVERGWCELYGIDIHPTYHELQKKIAIYDELYLGDARERLPYPDNYFHTSIVQHVIEHMLHRDGVRLLTELIRVTQNRIIVTTPNGYHRSDPGRHGNTFSEHLSGWSPKLLERLGYQTRVVTKNVNSRMLQTIARLLFKLQGKIWENQVIVAWKDVEPSQFSTIQHGTPQTAVEAKLRINEK